MQNEALVSAPLMVAAVLVASALGKLSDRRRAALAFDALKVPSPLAQPWMRAAHPWVELLLALFLVVAAGVPAVVTATITTVLAAAYLVLVALALQRPEPTDCACFGVGVSEEISGWTVLRNVWLLGLSGLAVWSALDGRSPIERAVDLGSDAWWLGAIAAAATMTALILHPSGPRSTGRVEHSIEGLDLEDYERTETPHAPVTTADGRVISLRELSRSRPQLILAVSATCSSCRPTIDSATHWRDRLPEVDVHVMYGGTPDPARSTSVEPQALYDPMRFALEALRLPGTPSAVLLGADGLLAGGPVVGHEAISSFVNDVEKELAGARLLPR